MRFMVTKPQKLSIVVPSYNQARYIDETLASLVNQRNIDPEQLEIIVIDGGSNDGTLAVIEGYADRLAYMVSEPDRGQTHALIKGFAQATGDVLGWLCSDDLIEPTTVQEVLHYFGSHPNAQFIYGDALWIDRNSKILRTKKEIGFSWFIWVYDHNYIPQPAAFWRRETYDQVGGLDEQFDLAMDADLWARFIQRTQPAHVRRTWARIRWYPEQKTRRLRGRSQAEDRQIRERLGASFDGRLRTSTLYMCAKSWRVLRKLTTGCYW